MITLTYIFGGCLILIGLVALIMLVYIIYTSSQKYLEKHKDDNY